MDMAEGSDVMLRRLAMGGLIYAATCMCAAGAAEYRATPRDENIPEDILLVVKTRNVISLINKVAVIADMVQPGAGMIVKAQAAARLQNPMLEGLDTARPSALLMRPSADGQDLETAVVLTATDASVLMQAMVQTIGLQGVDADGLLRLGDAYMGISGENLFLTNAQEFAVRLRDLLAQGPLLASPVNSDIEATLKTRGFVDAYGDRLLKMVEERKKRLAENPGRRGGGFMMEMITPFLEFSDEIIPLLRQLDGATGKLDIDTESGLVRLQVSVHAAEKSALAEIIGAQEKVDVSEARSLTALIPEGDVAMAGAFNTKAAKAVLAKTMTRLLEKYKTKTEAPDLLITTMLERGLGLLPESENCAVASSAVMGIDTMNRVAAVKPAVGVAEAVDTVNGLGAAYTQSPLRSLMKERMTGRRRRFVLALVPDGITATAIPEINGFHVRLDYGAGIDGNTAAMMYRVAGDPPGPYAAVKDGVMYWTLGGAGRQAADRITAGENGTPLSGSGIFKELMAGAPEKYNVASAVRYLHVYASSIAARRTPEDALALKKSLEMFLAKDKPMLFYATTKGTSVELDMRLDTVAVQNMVQAMTYVVMEEIRRIQEQQQNIMWQPTPAPQPDTNNGWGNVDDLGF
ncbi:MAG: hypothetical protein JW909_10545 [Planctomycetes bacterium]|nr:hypothetical protein [Planctomycetota bacterium]